MGLRPARPRDGHYSIEIEQRMILSGQGVNSHSPSMWGMGDPYLYMAMAVYSYVPSLLASASARSIFLRVETMVFQKRAIPSVGGSRAGGLWSVPKSNAGAGGKAGEGRYGPEASQAPRWSLFYRVRKEK